jgi:hypothetical protein
MPLEAPVSISFLVGRFASGLAPGTVPAPAPVNGYVILKYSHLLQVNTAPGTLIPVTPVRLPIVDGVLVGPDGVPSTTTPIPVQATDDPLLAQTGDGIFAQLDIVFDGGSEPVQAILALPGGAVVDIATASRAGTGGAVFVSGLAPSQLTQLRDALDDIEAAQGSAEAANAGAQNARTEAEAAAARAVAVATGQLDPAAAALVKNPASALTVALDGRFVQPSTLATKRSTLPTVLTAGINAGSLRDTGGTHFPSDAIAAASTGLPVPLAGLLTVDATARTRRNLVLDPRGSNAALWRASTGDSVAVVTDGGEPAIEITQGVAGSGVYLDPSQNFLLTPGDTVTFKIEVKAVAAMSAMRTQLSSYAGLTFVRTSPDNVRALAPADGWQTFTVTGTVGGTAGGYLRALIWPTTTPDLGPAFRVRKAIVEVALVGGPYFDGTMPATSTEIFSFEGAANASPSLSSGVVFREYATTSGRRFTQRLTASGWSPWLEEPGPMGRPGVQYKFVSGAIRNIDGVWSLVDGAHKSIAVEGVSVDENFVHIDYPSIEAKDIVSFVVTADETLAREGFEAGASVGLTRASIALTKAIPYSDYVSWSAANGWVSANGVFELSFTPTGSLAGTLTCKHKAFPVPPGKNPIWQIGITGRGNSIPSSHGANAESMQVRFHDYGGAVLTTPATTMAAFISHGMSGPADPRAVTTALYPNSNLWFMGIFIV